MIRQNRLSSQLTLSFEDIKGRKRLFLDILFSQEWRMVDIDSDIVCSPVIRLHTIIYTPLKCLHLEGFVDCNLTTMRNVWMISNLSHGCI